MHTAWRGHGPVSHPEPKQDSIHSDPTDERARHRAEGCGTLETQCVGCCTPRAVRAPSPLSTIHGRGRGRERAMSRGGRGPEHPSPRLENGKDPSRPGAGGEGTSRARTLHPGAGPGNSHVHAEPSSGRTPGRTPQGRSATGARVGVRGCGCARRPFCADRTRLCRGSSKGPGPRDTDTPHPLRGPLEGRGGGLHWEDSEGVLQGRGGEARSWASCQPPRGGAPGTPAPTYPGPTYPGAPPTRGQLEAGGQLEGRGGGGFHGEQRADRSHLGPQSPHGDGSLRHGARGHGGALRPDRLRPGRRPRQDPGGAHAGAGRGAGRFREARGHRPQGLSGRCGAAGPRARAGGGWSRGGRLRGGAGATASPERGAGAGARELVTGGGRDAGHWRPGAALCPHVRRLCPAPPPQSRRGARRPGS